MKKKEIINNLISKNKSEGFILREEIIACLETFNCDNKQLQNIYKKFTMAGIEILDLNNSMSNEHTYSPSEIESTDSSTKLDEISSYFISISKFPVLTAQEEHFYGKIIATSKHSNEVKVAKKIMIECNLKFVVLIAKHYKMKLPFLDLIQEGNIGLMKAVEKYDYNKNLRFSTYAAFWIRQSIRKAIDESGIIRLPVHIAEYYRKINIAKNKLIMNNNGKNPSLEEIAIETNIPLKKIEELLTKNYTTASLDSAINKNIDNEEFSLNDIIADPNQSVEEINIQMNLSREINMLIEGLSNKEKAVIVLRLGLNGDSPLTLEEIGQQLGLSRERIRQIEKQTLIKLRNNPKAHLLKSYLM